MSLREEDYIQSILHLEVNLYYTPENKNWKKTETKTCQIDPKIFVDLRKKIKAITL